MKVICCEYLQAFPAAWASASDSMRQEARMMLSALVQDIAALSGRHVRVCIGDGIPSIPGAGTSGNITEHRISAESSIAEALSAIAGQNDQVFVIAPECDGILTSLVRHLHQTLPADVSLLNLDAARTQTFSDKYQTYLWLQEQRLPGIPTRLVSDEMAQQLLQQTVRADAAGDGWRHDRNAGRGWFVLKPRYGVGSDSVCIRRLDESVWQSCGRTDSPDSNWILQPLISGDACSVGLIGGGLRGPSVCLPGARQSICLDSGQLRYTGGVIPCQTCHAGLIETVAEQLLQSLAPFSGYVGADLIVNSAAPQNVRIVEINPRLCTSYVGYRSLSKQNLASWILQIAETSEIPWKNEIVRFGLSGMFALQSGSVPVNHQEIQETQIGNHRAH